MESDRKSKQYIKEINKQKLRLNYRFRLSKFISMLDNISNELIQHILKTTQCNDILNNIQINYISTMCLKYLTMLHSKILSDESMVSIK